MSPRLASPAHPSSGGLSGGGGATPGRGRGGGGLSKRDREFIGQTVKIIQGPFKGKLINFKISANVKALYKSYKKYFICNIRLLDWFTCHIRVMKPKVY